MLDIAILPTFLSQVYAGLQRVSDPDSADYFYRLSYLTETTIKAMVAAMYAATAPYDSTIDEKLSSLFEKDSLGGWMTVLDSLCQVSGTLPADCKGSKQMSQWILQKRRKDDVWFQELQTACDELVKLSGGTPRSATKVLPLLHSLVEVRNKTRGHGAHYPDYFEIANKLLETLISGLISDCPAFSWHWIIPNRHGVIRLIGAHPSTTKDLQIQVSEQNFKHLCVVPEEETIAYSCHPIITATKEGTEYFFLNSAVRDNQAEYLDYATGKIQDMNLVTGSITASSNPPIRKTIEVQKQETSKKTASELRERSRNHSFMGREDVLEQLVNQFKGSRVVVLCGISGVGKSETAAEYFYANRHKYSTGVWLQADSQTSLENSCALQTGHLTLNENKNVDSISAVRQWLEQNEKWLLIVDDAINPSLVKSVLPPSLSGDVLITSQNPNWKSIGTIIAVTEFPLNVAIQFLRRRTNLEENISELIATRLFRLPLALDQAASYIEATDISGADYLRLLDEYSISDLVVADEGQRTLSNAIGLTLNRLSAEAPAVAGLLKVFCFFSTVTIPFDLILWVARAMNEAILPNDITGELQLIKAVSHLRKYSLVTEGRFGILIHSAIQAFVKHMLNSQELKQYSELALHSGSLLYRLDAGNPLHQYILYLTITHIESAIKHAKSLGLDKKVINCAMAEVAMQYSSLGCSGLAEDILTEVHKALSDCDDSEALMSVIGNRALVLSKLNRTDEARELYDQLFAHFRAQGQLDSPKAAVPLNNYAEFLAEQGDLIQAERMLKRALENASKDPNFSKVNHARMLNNLGNNYHAQKRYKLAELNHKKALEIRLALPELGENHDDTASSYHNLAQVYSVTERFEEAHKLFELAEKIHKSNGILPNLHYARTVYEHSQSLIRQGDYKRALDLLLQGLEATDNTNEPLFLEARARLLIALMQLKAEKGELADADEYGHSALKLIRQSEYLDSFCLNAIEEYAEVLKMRNKTRKSAALKLAANELRLKISQQSNE